MANLPQDVGQQALDAAGIDFEIGDLEEGTQAAKVLLRAYAQCRRQLLRAAHWDFARRTVPLVLLADATGNTPDVGTLVVDPRFIYEYAYPGDCLKARFIPWNSNTQQAPVPNGNIQIPVTPQTTGGGQPPLSGQRIIPARFTIANDINYPPDPNQIWWEVQGLSPGGRTVVLTNVREALLIYTADVIYPNVWDPQFRAGLVAYLASEIVMALHKDKKFATQLRMEQIRIAKEKITAARITDGNEMVASSDIPVDWMITRSSGGAGFGRAGWGGGEAGCLGYGFDTALFADGSAY